MCMSVCVHACVCACVCVWMHACVCVHARVHMCVLCVYSCTLYNEVHLLGWQIHKYSTQPFELYLVL